MKLNHITIFIIILLFACNRENKWKDVKRIKFNRQESYNYSEMLSGDLDSTDKSELEQFKEHNKKKQINTKELPSQSKMVQLVSTAIEGVKRFLNYFTQSNLKDKSPREIIEE